MPSIIKNFKIQLSRKQTKEVREHLNGIKEKFYVLAAQTLTNDGQFEVTQGEIVFAALSQDCGSEIESILNKHRYQPDPMLQPK